MAVTADSVVVDLIANVDKADANMRRYGQTFDATTKTIEVSSQRAENAIVKMSDRGAYATRNFGRQVSDVGVQLGGGASPFLIIVQQGPQVIDALDEMRAAGVGLGAALKGIALPGILAVASSLLPLITSLYDTGDAADHAKEKLSDFSTFAGLARFATQIVKDTEELGKLQNELNEILRQGGPTAQGQTYARNTARARELTEEIELARANLASNQATLEGQEKRIKTENSLQDAADKRREAEREAESARDKASSKAEQESRRLQSSLSSMEKTYSPLTASVREYEAALEDIDKLERLGPGRGGLDAGTAAAYREAADAARILAAQRAEARDRADPNERIRATVDASDTEMARSRQAAIEAQGRAMRELYAREEEQVRSLASIYEDAFLGGTGSIWQTFEREGLRVLALLLAKFTILQSTKGGSIGGNLSSAFSSVAGSIFGGGRASGGFVQGGTAYRVNEGASPGRVEGFRPLGSGHIIPLGQMNAAQPSGGVTVMQTIQVDAKGAVMNDQFAAMILERSGQQAIEVGRVAASAAQSGTMRTLQRPRLPGSLG